MLDFSNKNLSDSDISRLGRDFKEDTEINFMDLSHNNLTDVGIK